MLSDPSSTLGISTNIRLPVLYGRKAVFFVQILDIFFPKRCIHCGKVGRYFCAGCRGKIRVIAENEPICPMCEKPAVGGYTHPRCQTRYSPDGLTSFFHYDGPVRRAVKAIKYRHISDLASEFVSLVPLTLLRIPIISNQKRSCLIPIPLHFDRFRSRGFNQAEVFGALLAHKLHVPMRTDILARTRATTAQVEMKNRKERLSNMTGAFTISRSVGSTLTGQKIRKRMIPGIILFDDVFTTGATMRAAANVLKRNGATYVWAVTMAR